ELRERGRHLARSETRGAQELVGAGGAPSERLEHARRGFAELDRRGRTRQAEALENVACAGRRCRTQPEQRVRAGGQRRGDLPRDREDLTTLLQREIRRDQRAAALARLDDDRRGAQTGDDS